MRLKHLGMVSGRKFSTVQSLTILKVMVYCGLLVLISLCLQEEHQTRSSWRKRGLRESSAAVLEEVGVKDQEQQP